MRTLINHYLGNQVLHTTAAAARPAGTMILLGVNIDHVATLRQARGTEYPEPAGSGAARPRMRGPITSRCTCARTAGISRIATSSRLRKALRTRMNLEAAVTPEMIAFARRVRPHDVCLVPERRAELTTEGGLDVAGALKRVGAGMPGSRRGGHPGVAVHRSPTAGRSMPRCEQARRWWSCIPGRYAEARSRARSGTESSQESGPPRSTRPASGLHVNAGHGLNYDNVEPVAAIAGSASSTSATPSSRGRFSWAWREAVREMKALLGSAR